MKMILQFQYNYPEFRNFMSAKYHNIDLIAKYHQPDLHSPNAEFYFPIENELELIEIMCHGGLITPLFILEYAHITQPYLFNGALTMDVEKAYRTVIERLFGYLDEIIGEMSENEMDASSSYLTLPIINIYQYPDLLEYMADICIYFIGTILNQCGKYLTENYKPDYYYLTTEFSIAGNRTHTINGTCLLDKKQPLLQQLLKTNLSGLLDFKIVYDAETRF